jgi:2'-5' RNA ligase
MTVIRAFIAIELSPEIQDKLKEVIIQNKRQLDNFPIRWVPGDNIHLTLKFLGDVSIASLDLLTDTLKTECSHHPPFEISVGESGAYPRTNRPRVLWVGVKAPQELYILQKGIEAQMEKLGYARESRPFSPHLTLGRVKSYTSTSDLNKITMVIESNKVGFLGAKRVKDVILFKSDLKPSGAEYTKIFTASLQA